MNKNVHMLKLFLESVMLLTSLKKKRVGWELETGDKSVSLPFDASREQSACWLCPYLTPGSGFCVFPNRAPRYRVYCKVWAAGMPPRLTIPRPAYRLGQWPKTYIFNQTLTPFSRCALLLHSLTRITHNRTNRTNRPTPQSRPSCLQ